MNADWDSIALQVARQFTQDTEVQRRANLQVAVRNAIRTGCMELAFAANTYRNQHATYAQGYEGFDAIAQRHFDHVLTKVINS